MKLFYFVFAVMLITFNSAFSQKFDLGSWNIINLKYNFDEKWSFFGEAQVRSLKFYTNFHYYEYKGGASFKAHKNLSLTIGAGSYQTYKEGGDFVLPKNNDEFRIWPQLVLMQSLGKLKIEQRYRSEFRFTSIGYRNRFRYRLGLSYPLGKEREGFNPFQFNVSNELFFTDSEPYFERNRISFAFSYKPSNISTVQIGYLQQFDYKINDETGRDFLQIGYFIEIGRKESSTKSIVADLIDN
jgi:hypothetical protein